MQCRRWVFLATVLAAGCGSEGASEEPGDDGASDAASGGVNDSAARDGASKESDATLGGDAGPLDRDAGGAGDAALADATMPHTDASAADGSAHHNDGSAPDNDGAAHDDATASASDASDAHDAALPLDAYGGCPCDGAIATGEPGVTCAVSPAAAPGSGPAVAVDRWMEQGAAVLAGVPLAEVVLPGTHDSATYALIDTVNRPANDLFAPDANNVLVQLGSLANITQGWSKAQDRSIGEQLADGIRTVDLRLCLDKSDTFRLCHGLYGPQLDDVLTDIGSFASSHPREVVVLFASGFTDWSPSLPDGGPDYGNMSAANIARARAKIASALGPWLLDHGAFTAMTTLGTIWATQPGRTVAVVFERDPVGPFWSDARHTGSWVDTWHQDAKKKSLESALAADTARCPHCTLFEFSGEVTDDATLIEAALLPGTSFPRNLRDLADAANPVILGWVRDEFIPAGRRVNVLQMDFYDRACLVPFALAMNGVPGPSLEGCAIGTSTAWGSWWNESLGSACVTDAQCASSHCAAVCVACKSNADCGNGHLCLGATCL